MEGEVMNKSSKFIVAGLIVVAAVAYLLVSGFSSSSVYYLEVKEVLAHPEKFNKKGMRVSGDIVDGSVIKDVKNQHLVFGIEDHSGGKMTVEYKGIIPDNFNDEIQVIVEGKYDTVTKKFVAKTLLTKCPSKYEAEDVNDHNEAVKKG